MAIVVLLLLAVIPGVVVGYVLSVRALLLVTAAVVVIKVVAFNVGPSYDFGGFLSYISFFLGFWFAGPMWLTALIVRFREIFCSDGSWFRRR